MPSTMQALVLHAVGDIRLERVPIPVPGPGQALIRVAAAGICGSDVPRIFEHGTYRFPLIPGHEFSGVVEQVYAADPSWIGRRVAVKPLIPCHQCRYCQIGAFGQCASYDYLGSRSDGAFAEYVVVPVENLVPLADGVSLVATALCEPAAVALHALRQGGVQPGDAVAILGCGPIGMLLAQWARLWGAGTVLLVDIDAAKLSLADQLGLGLTCNARSEDPVAWAERVTAGQGVALVVEAAGVAATLVQALQIARPLGQVVLMGNPSGDVTLPQQVVSQVLRKQLRITGTWNSHFAALPVDEWQVVADMLAAGRLDLDAVISHRVPLAEGVAALEMMRSRGEFFNRVVLTIDSEAR
jgi:L-iditol 2-dehydrogenase